MDCIHIASIENEKLKYCSKDASNDISKYATQDIAIGLRKWSQIIDANWNEKINKHGFIPIGKNNLIDIINNMRNEIAKEYKSLLADEDEMKLVISEKITLWTSNRISPYCLRNDERNMVQYNGPIAFELTIWDLVSLLKFTNWETHTVVAYEW